MTFVHIARYTPAPPAGTAANATIFTLQNTLEYAENRKICSIVAKNMRFCKYYCI